MCLLSEGDVVTDPSPGPGAKSYRLVRFLREGGFGSVFQAQILPDSAEYVAVKAIQKDKLCDEKLKTVKNEIRIQSRLEHDNVAKLLGCFESELHVFLILEYFSGGDLEQRLHEHGPFSEPEARGMLRQLLSGISYLHKHHILHRDLKLANVLLDKERVALCDFGLAVNVQSSDNTRRTLCGTPNSISPEVISQEKQTYAVDIWGLGIILYSLLVGKAPFDTGNVKTTFGQVQNQNPDYPPNLSGQAMHLLNGMLRKSMGERINLEQTLRHPFFSSSSSGSSPSTSSYSSHLTSDSGIGGGSNNNNTNSSSNAGPYLRGFPEIRQPLLGHIAEAPTSLVGTGSIRKCPSSTRLSATAAPTSSSSKPCPPLSSPLNAERLRASSHHRQELKPGVLGGIAPSGEVTFEFKIPRNKYGLAAIETVTVSCDGLTITVERTDQSECRQVYKHDTLPRTYWQKYNFMSRYVQCVREMTPKVTLYTAQAQCHLMENGPVANFEVNFYSGQKVKFNSGSGRITLQETSDRSSSASYFSYPITRSTDNNALHLLKQFEEWHLQCKTIDKLLTEASPELSVAFPVVIGRRRKEAQLPGGAGGTGVSVSTTVTRATINPRSIMSLSASSQRSYYSPLSPSNYASSR